MSLCEDNEIWQQSISKFADRLAKRRETIEVRVRHALLRVESDALANALRKNEERKQTQRKREELVERLLEALRADQNKLVRECSDSEMSEECKKQREATHKAKRAMIQAMKGGMANFNEAARELKRTSREVGDWRADVSMENGGRCNKPLTIDGQCNEKRGRLERATYLGSCE